MIFTFNMLLESQSFDVWNIIEEGYHPTTAVEQDSEGNVTSVKFKPKKDWTQGEKDRASLNAKAKMLCSLKSLTEW